MVAVEAAFIERFGAHAGWAHNTLFISDLASQQHRLPVHLRSRPVPASGKKAPVPQNDQQSGMDDSTAPSPHLPPALQAAAPVAAGGAGSAAPPEGLGAASLVASADIAGAAAASASLSSAQQPGAAAQTAADLELSEGRSMSSTYTGPHGTSGMGREGLSNAAARDSAPAAFTLDWKAMEVSLKPAASDKQARSGTARTKRASSKSHRSRAASQHDPQVASSKQKRSALGIGSRAAGLQSAKQPKQSPQDAAGLQPAKFEAAGLQSAKQSEQSSRDAAGLTETMRFEQGLSAHDQHAGVLLKQQEFGLRPRAGPASYCSGQQNLGLPVRRRQHQRTASTKRELPSVM